jgi:hypothetical protein
MIWSKLTVKQWFRSASSVHFFSSSATLCVAMSGCCYQCGQKVQTHPSFLWVPTWRNQDPCTDGRLVILIYTPLSGAEKGGSGYVGWKPIKSVRSHGNSLLLFLMKVTVWHLVSDSCKVMDHTHCHATFKLFVVVIFPAIYNRDVFYFSSFLFTEVVNT